MHHVVHYIIQTMWGHSLEDHIMKWHLRMGLCSQECTAGIVKCNTSIFLTYNDLPNWKPFSHLEKFMHVIWKSATSAWVPSVYATSLYLATCTWVVMGEYCMDLQLVFEKHLLSMYIFSNHIFLIICFKLSMFFTWCVLGPSIKSLKLFGHGIVFNLHWNWGKLLLRKLVWCNISPLGFSAVNILFS